MRSPSGRSSTEEPLVPTPTRTIPGIEPIVVQVVENLFPRNTRKRAFACIRQRKEADLRIQLGLLFYSQGDIEKLLFASRQSHVHFWMDEILSIFRTMEQAEEWVKSISNARA